MDKKAKPVRKSCVFLKNTHIRVDTVSIEPVRRSVTEEIIATRIDAMQNIPCHTEAWQSRAGSSGTGTRAVISRFIMCSVQTHLYYCLIGILQLASSLQRQRGQQRRLQFQNLGPNKLTDSIRMGELLFSRPDIRNYVKTPEVVFCRLV